MERHVDLVTGTATGTTVMGTSGEQGISNGCEGRGVGQRTEKQKNSWDLSPVTS